MKELVSNKVIPDLLNQFFLVRRGNKSFYKTYGLRILLFDDEGRKEALQMSRQPRSYATCYMSLIINFAMEWNLSLVSAKFTLNWNHLIWSEIDTVNLGYNKFNKTGKIWNTYWDIVKNVIFITGFLSYQNVRYTFRR